MLVEFKQVEVPSSAPALLPSLVHGTQCWPMTDMVSPCEAACPLGQDVPNYVIAIAQGKFDEALAIIRRTNPLPSICGRVCHHPCEDVCNRKVLEEPIAIRALKRAAVDYGSKAGRSKGTSRKGPKKDRVAIVGSGPAGLTAAHDLAKKGYAVDIYEASPVVGGMLATSIPEFVLPRQILEADISHITNLGVRIKTNTAIGRDLSTDDLFKLGFKAILLATGAQENSKLPIPGTDLEGVTYALPFLLNAKIGGRQPLFDKKVVIIGGGNVAIDAARCALRLEAKEVHLACLESKRQMPAYSWEIEAALKEGLKLHPSLAPQRFNAKQGKRMGSIDFKRVASFKRFKDGSITWTLMEGTVSDSIMDADLVIIAIGQVSTPPDSIGSVALGNKKTIEVDPLTMATNVPGIFAAGDVVQVPGTVSESMAAGRSAATSIDRFLQRKELKRGRQSPPKAIFELKSKDVPLFLKRESKWQVPIVAPSDAIRSFDESTLGYTRWQAIEEAKRCLNCRMCGNCIFEHVQLCLETAGRLLV